MEDEMTARDRKVKESEEQYSPLTNRPHPSTSLLGERASKLIESLHEGVWLVDREACTVFVHPRLAAMLRYDVEEVIGQSLFPYCNERCAETRRYNLRRRRFGIAEQYDFELVQNDTGPGATGDLDTIFQRVRTTKAGGVGLDLTIYKRIEEAHGGRIGCGEYRRESRSLAVRLPIISARQVKEGGVHSWEARPS